MTTNQVIILILGLWSIGFWVSGWVAEKKKKIKAMTNIEKIRQEIERRKKICEGIFERESDTYYQGKAVAYGELLAFIDSLPEEKHSEDLEEAAEELFETIEIQAHENIFEDTFKKIFIAGAKWQKEQLLKGSPLPEDTVLFNKGVEEGKRLMMEDAARRK